MAKHLTPVVGLAVVMALALAAVFGSMSLANPAQASGHEVMVYTAHERVEIDLADHLTGTFDDYDVELVPGRGDAAGINAAFEFYDAEEGGNETDLAVGPISGDGALGPVDATADTPVTNFYVAGLVGGLSGGLNQATYAFKITGSTEAEDDTEPSVVIEITLLRSVAAESVTGDDLDLMIYTSHEQKVDLKKYFTSGTGSGVVDSATVDVATVEALAAVESASVDAETDMLTIKGAATRPPADADNTDVAITATATLLNAGTATAAVLITIANSGEVMANTTPIDPVTLTYSASPLTTMVVPDAGMDGMGAGFEQYFTPGVGTGAIEGFSYTSDDPGTVSVRPSGDNRVQLTARRVGNALITVTASDGAPTPNMVSRTFDVTVVAEAVQEPTVPMLQNIMVHPGDTQLTVSWTALGTRALLNVERLEYAYKMTPGMGDVMFEDADWNILDKAASGVTISNLTNGTSYTVGVRVVATDETAGDALDNPVGATVMEAGMPVRVAVSALEPMASGVAASKAITITWYDLDDRIDGWQVRYKESDATTEGTWMPLAADARSYSITGLANGTMYTVELQGLEGTTATMSWTSDFTPMAPPAAFQPSFTAGSTSSGSNTNYRVRFQTGADALNTLRDELVVEFHEDYSLPGSISSSSVTIDVNGAIIDDAVEGDKTVLTFNPSDIVVDGEEAVFSLGDMNEDDDVSQYDIGPMATITVNFRQVAGISNPTEAGDYELVKIAFGDFEIEYNEDDSTHADLLLEDGVRRKMSLSEEDGGLGDVVTATGKGFENGVTLHFFLDKNKDGVLNRGEDVLCSVERTTGSNIGSCDFEVTTPTFSTGYNYINAVDGDGNEVYDPDNDDSRFELKASISATPAGGSPGEIMQVQLVSFPPNSMIDRVTLSGDNICGGTTPPPGRADVVPCRHGNVNSQGNASISVTVPNWGVGGVQELRVYAGGKNDPTNVAIAGPRIISTPQTVVANQRVSLVGTGFSPRSVIGEDEKLARISIGGDDIDWARVNNGRDVDVDDGGNWSAAVDLPLSEATTGVGKRTIRITDSMGRTGNVTVTLAQRDFDITPPTGRVGTLAVVRGVGYPSKNDEGDSFTVDVTYNVQEGTSTRVSVVPDASGRFEVQVRIPTTASIPSTNQVEVKFELEDGTEVLENKQHNVPEGIISLSETSGGPGSTITISGEGYKAFVNVDSVKIGTFDVTPAPKPHTNGNGMMSFSILIPGIDVGIQTIEVQVGGTTSSTGFTVTESGINPGDIVEVAKGIEELGDNLVSVWNFNNDTKVWAFYDPTLEEGNTLTHMITGETYLIRIKTDAEVILNRDTRNLTCVGGNCWNQVVW